ncbi:carboxymuconolactone decarboxylase family protein [Streptomyces lasiicapitis]|uniref:Alkyl hydroperoxide reductase AhpD n=1 Tax=Streptomyces lasiicapitis TaxID=1923961 RepID=A0ABQ2LLF3_9ACTN|nr:carboxymuconolactone decarboxylase family protein [Streptomyces lasiicapitis]GGO35888.1 alkyl hydroperoxide reductase AhpD [Streptomyces lasiicapitis]
MSSSKRGAKVSLDVMQGLMAAGQAASKGLDVRLKHLLEIRASQINHCAYCIDMHIKDAKLAGETDERIYFLNAWEEAASHYSEKEQAALALTEAITVLTDGFVPDEVYERAAKHFDERELGQLISTITLINAWNRINVSIRNPPTYKPGEHA